MTARFEEIQDIPLKQVRFFTIRLGKEDISEFEKFDLAFSDDLAHRKELQLIYSTIDEISRRGAKEYFFRPEGPAHALPGRVSKKIKLENKTDYGLRLYANIVNNNTVILLNGGIKTHIKPDLCPNVKDHFNRAKKCAVRLRKAIDDEIVKFTLEDGMECDNEEFSIDL